METQPIRTYLLACAALLLALVFGCQGAPEEGSAEAVEDAAPDAAFEVLVFSKTDGFRHESIPDGIEAIRELGEAHDFAVTVTEDAAHFTETPLERYAAIVFLNPTGALFDDAQRTAFREYIQRGGGFVGVHAAADAEYDWPWYNQLIGAYLDEHSSVQEAVIYIIDDEHPSTEMLPDPWTRTDEWYSFRDLQPRVDILLNLDEGSYDLGGAPAMGAGHPIAWHRTFDGGRSWYTGMGHTTASYEEDAFLEHLLGGILWAAGQTEDDSGMGP